MMIVDEDGTLTASCGRRTTIAVPTSVTGAEIVPAFAVNTLPSRTRDVYQGIVTNSPRRLTLRSTAAASALAGTEVCRTTAILMSFPFYSLLDDYVGTVL